MQGMGLEITLLEIEGMEQGSSIGQVPCQADWLSTGGLS
ncbi:uncharacterized protein BDCG_17310 [Blastomyces dermatitidis ER-3]|uniref:Uncharacterized protein n=1 Tax=Ajellomyces dermatitidis (strain ER-3 / ATCC MYA-2586) TaxID=559297 RepID=A0ABX2VXT7_AJEDR|nr:uncharacterized protein BDCG_17310 [Blastomyces dermatitidis ER-3]OAT01956.1 hypothetical protein BDCG_17310 [Blastomyces dermatitidis ER-3]